MKRKKKADHPAGKRKISPSLRSRFFFRLAAGIVVSAFALRLIEFFRGLEYDEIWTLTEFSSLSCGEILTKLALPNNQPLNTLCVKLLAPFVPYFPPLVRLHSLLAGVGSVLLTGIAALLLFRDRKSSLYSMLFLALSAPCAIYSQLARGYELQLFFLLLSGIGAALAQTPRGCLSKTLIVLGGAGAALTLTTSAVYLPAVLLALWAVSRRLPERRFVLFLCCCAAAGGLWYGFLSQEILQGRVWSTPLRSWNSVWNFYRDTLGALLPWGLLPLCAAALLWCRRSRPLLLIPVIVLLSALATGGGPARVYLPLSAVFSLLAGAGAAQLVRHAGKAGKLVVLGVILLAGWSWRQLYPKWRIEDVTEAFYAASKLPEDHLLAFRATSSYVVAWNTFPRGNADFQNRLQKDQLTRLVMFAPAGRLNGSDMRGAEKELVLPFAGEKKSYGGMEAFCYRLERRDSGAVKKGAFYLVIPKVYLPAAGARLMDAFSSGALVFRLNVFLSVPPEPGDRRSFWPLVLEVLDPERIDGPGLSDAVWYEIVR